MYKVLIIEDEILFRKALNKIIESMEEYMVIGQLEDGEGALEFCEKEKPDFVCVDIVLPGENGLDVGKRIKEKYPSTVIFILSACNHFQMVQTAMRMGLDAYMTKPYDAGEIKSAFRRYQHLFEKNNSEQDVLTVSMRDKNIMETFQLCRKLAADIFSLYYKEPERYEELQRITDYCISYIGTLMAGKQQHYEKKYNLIHDIQKYPCIAEAFLHFIMLDIYRLQMISKYPQFNVILSYIHGNIEKEITLNEIADMCAMSTGYITRIFKRYYGIGIVDYAHLIKILWAKLYLACTELSISDISYSLGYNDPGYFGKVFKKYEGMTPTLYKRNYVCQGYNISESFRKLL